MTDVSVHVLRQVDVADAIDLAELAKILSHLDPTRGAAVLRGTERATGAGVMLRNEPMDLRIGLRLIGPFTGSVRLRVFDFGVIAVRFTFTASPDGSAELIDLARRVASEAPSFDREARAIWKELSARIKAAIAPWEQPPSDPLIEDYTVFVLPKLEDGDPDDLLAHMLFAEPANRKLAPAMLKELGRRAIRYYEDDLVVVDYDTAIVVDEGGAADIVDIFEIASAQLLEVRYYDALLARALGSLSSNVRLARTTSWFFRSPFRGVARRSASLALEVSEMNDRLERSITLVGETYYVQVYREAALRFRLPEASAAVREKMNLITRVGEVAQGEVQTRRGMAVELLVVVLIALEILVAIGWPVAHH